MVGIDRKVAIGAIFTFASALIGAGFWCGKLESEVSNLKDDMEWIQTELSTIRTTLIVNDTRGRLRVVLEGVENLRTGVKEPTTELVKGFQENVAKLEELHTELESVDVSEDEAAAYAEATTKVEAAIEGVNGLAKLTENATGEYKLKMTDEELEDFSEDAMVKYLEAAEYAAPDVAARLAASPEFGP